MHWQFDAQRLGEDEHGVWLFVAQGTTARRGEEAPLSIPYGFAMLVPLGEPWLVEFYWDHPKHPVYVNIGTHPVWHGDRVSQIDLDLDVIRTPDGEVFVLDEDEFAEHQIRHHYPQHLITGARAATERAVELLTARAEPFAGAADPWLRAAQLG